MEITITKEEFDKIAAEVVTEMSKDFNSIEVNKEKDSLANMCFMMQNTLVIANLRKELFKEEKEPKN